jgi:peptide-methionine (S)-S-oxide reductase
MLNVFTMLCVTLLSACSQPEKPFPKLDQLSESNQSIGKTMSAGKIDTATFGAGCFWCVEAVFQRLDGVETVVSGYAGGKVANPTYEQVCDGTTGHAEVCQVTYNPEKVSYAELLEVFWKTHDPTTLNRQGNDVGTQYRSAIFYHNDEQKKLAETYKAKLEAAKIFDNPIVTEIAPLPTFYKAENYHQNYYNTVGSRNGYCSFVITPKVEKFKKVFGDKMKKEYKAAEK